MTPRPLSTLYAQFAAFDETYFETEGAFAWDANELSCARHENSRRGAVDLAVGELLACADDYEQVTDGDCVKFKSSDGALKFYAALAQLRKALEGGRV